MALDLSSRTVPMTIRRRNFVLNSFLALALVACGAMSLLLESSPLYIYPNENVEVGEIIVLDEGEMVPQKLLDLKVYQESDFVNEIGKRPVFWEPNNTVSWGPCYPEASEKPQKWTGSSKLVYRRKDADRNNADFSSTQGGCRPGFLIIGAGKCGTSSLYHYLTGHPRVAPAYEKQIHYFKYNIRKPLGWYYSWFPTTTSFLQSGALMTGEASPGYLPYPQVVHQIYSNMPGPKFIAVGRNPLERAYSSYRYNYIQPTLDYLHKGPRTAKDAKDILPEQNRSYYDQFLFSFEDLIQAELKRLRECLNGFGINATRISWGNPGNNWTLSEFERRDELGLDPLIALDGVCYGKANKTALRPQWAELQRDHPNKVIMSKFAFLVQSMIGRSLYVFPLEWWYILFEPEDILFVCTEDLSNATVINDLAMQMGLPSYNFTDVIAEGAYNVGGHRGYDTATSWETLETNETKDDDDDGIPLSPELRKEVLEFIAPYNERLFALTGRRCNWF